MIYLVSKQKSLFNSTEYKCISVEDSLDIINGWVAVQFDTETSGRNPHICKLLTAQFGSVKDDTQIVVDCTIIDFKLYKDVLETKLIVGHNLKFDCQFCYKYSIVPCNIWDTMVIEQFLHLGYNPKNIRYSLQAVAERRLGIHIDKTVRGEIIWRGIDERVIKYAAGDVVYLEDIMRLQRNDCVTNNCITGAKLENAFVPVIAYLEWSGIYLNEDKWKAKMKQDLINKQKAEEVLNDWLIDYFEKHPWNKKLINKSITINQYDKTELSKWNKIVKNRKVSNIKGIDNFDGTITYNYNEVSENPYLTKDLQGDLFSGFSDKPKVTINWSSPTQLIPFLKLLGFSVKTEDKKTGESKESAVEKLITKQKGINDEFLRLYFGKGNPGDEDYYAGYSGACKVCSTYGQQYLDAINPITGRIHTTFKQLGATSGRMSCGNSKDCDKDLARLKGIPASRCKYVQIQNLPADVETRGCFTNQSGTLICSTDYSALESRLGADIYNEEAMIDEFVNGSGDLHSLMAATFFDNIIPAGTPTYIIKQKYKEERKNAKSPEFLIQFGGGAKGLANQLGCSIKQAQEYIDKYYNKFKGIAEFKAKGDKFVKDHGYILICKYTGHKVYWEDWDKWKAIENTPEEIRKQEYTKDELKEHNIIGSKWARMALNQPTQGEPCPV